MQRIIVTAAAALFSIGLVVTAAKADMNYGPMTNNGLCFVRSTGWADMGFGYWTECPKPAAPTAAVVHHHRAKHS